jgi:hypothetical protein
MASSRLPVSQPEETAKKDGTKPEECMIIEVPDLYVRITGG